MADPLILGLRAVFAHARDQLVSSVRSAMLENIVIKEARQHIRIIDREGRLAGVRRYTKYAVGWYSPDYFAPQRITLESGKIGSLSIIEPPQLDYEVLEGGIGQGYCVFRIRAPSTSPTYMLRKRPYGTVVVDYEALDAYTDDAPRPCRWVFRLPKGSPVPDVVKFRLDLPEGRPMLTAARVYRLDNLATAEGAHTDKTLAKVHGWERLPDPCMDSRLRFGTDLEYADWHLRPFKTDVAYKIEWDWWDQSG